MFSSIQLYVMLCVAAGIALLAAFVLKGGGALSDCTIARVLYDAEHPERVR